MMVVGLNSFNNGYLLYILAHNGPEMASRPTAAAVVEDREG